MSRRRRHHNPDRQQQRQPITARYDAAQTTPENRRHWSAADLLGPMAANTGEVRRILRARSRYETANNSYARGIVETLAQYTVGTGPRLQMRLTDPKANAKIEAAFAEWADAIGLADKLRIAAKAKIQDGEAFAILTTNPAVPNPVKLDISLAEADAITDPKYGRSAYERTDADGIEYDRHGNPTSYALTTHPGEQGTAGLMAKPRRIPAADVIHWFRSDRPGQRRGIPETTPALELFAQLRRYTAAVVAAAETAADFAVVIYTDLPPNSEAAEVVGDRTIDMERRKVWFAPDGWKPAQIDAKQPTTTYGEFKEQILNEIARCLNIPFNIAAGNSSKYNYASGRLDHQAFFKAIRVTQSHMTAVVLAPIFRAWAYEASLAGLIPRLTPEQIQTLPIEWFWDGHEHVDPLKEAAATATRLQNHTTTLAAEYARQGRDWEAELVQRAAELKKCHDLGIEPILQAAPPPAAKTAPSRKRGR